jgi:hypothetical protein
MNATKSLVAALIACGTFGVAVAQTTADERIPPAGQATQTQTDTRPSWVKNSNRKTPEQVEVENGNKAAPSRSTRDLRTAPPYYDQSAPQQDVDPMTSPSGQTLQPYRN